MTITYKNIELCTRGGIVTGKAFVCYETAFQKMDHMNFSAVSDSEAACLVDINRQIKERTQQLETLLNREGEK